MSSFAIGALVVFALPLFFSTGRAFGDRVLDGLAACYPNVGYIGLPLAFLAFGPPSAPGSTIAAVFTACVLFRISISLLELDLHRGPAFGVAMLKGGGSLARQPNLLAPIVSLTGTPGWGGSPA